MKKYIYIIYLFFLVFYSCNEKKTEVITVPVLRASSIYMDDSVYNYMQLFADQHRVIAHSYLDKAKELVESNPKKAIYYYKRAITLFPEYDTYKELGTLAMKLGMYEEAGNAYSMIVLKSYIKINNDYEQIYLFKEPNKDDYYEYLVSKIIRDNYLDYYEIYQLKDAGYDVKAFKDKLIADERIKLERNSEVFQNMLFRFMSDEELEDFKNSEMAYKEFIQSIKDSSIAFEINEKNVSHFKYIHTYDGEEGMNLSDMFIYFLQEKQEKPDNWYEYNFNHRIKINDSIYAITYSIDTSASSCPVEMRHIYHRLVTYNKGKIVDSKIIALQSGEDLMTMKYINNEVECSSFKRTWKKPYYKEDFDNEIVSKTLSGQKKFQIQQDGKITETGLTEQSAPVAETANDSTSS